MIQNKPTAKVAFGLSLITTGVITLVVLIVNPGASLRVYGSLIVVFASLFGLFYAVPHVPSLYADACRQLAEAERLLTEAARSKQERKTGFAFTGPAPAKTVDQREEAWRAWLLAKLDDAERVGGIHYSGAMDSIMDYSLWRNYFVEMLMDLKFAGPVVDRQRTELVEPHTIAGVKAAIASGMILPYPEGVNPPSH